MVLPPTPDTLHLGCTYHLHSSHRFLSTWGAVTMLEKKMADKTRIKVAVIEGDYADLCSLGLPLALSLQLQLQDLKLSGALWSAIVTTLKFKTCVDVYRI